MHTLSALRMGGRRRPRFIYGIMAVVRPAEWRIRMMTIPRRGPVFTVLRIQITRRRGTGVSTRSPGVETHAVVCMCVSRVVTIGRRRDSCFASALPAQLWQRGGIIAVGACIHHPVGADITPRVNNRLTQMNLGPVREVLQVVTFQIQVPGIGPGGQRHCMHCIRLLSAIRDSHRAIVGHALKPQPRVTVDGVVAGIMEFILGKA